MKSSKKSIIFLRKNSELIISTLSISSLGIFITLTLLYFASNVFSQHLSWGKLWLMFDIFTIAVAIITSILSIIVFIINIRDYKKYFQLTEHNSTKAIKNPPFSFLLKIADLISKKQREILHQEVSDMRIEYYEALSEKKVLRARLIIGFYYIGLTWSAVLWISGKIKKVVGLIPQAD